MPATPKRAGREARGGARFPSEVLADNVRAFRTLRGLRQQQLADRMEELGWSRATVGEVERNVRNVTVDELFGLAACLGVTIGQLLDPTGPDHSRQQGGLDIGIYDNADGSHNLVGAWAAHLWANSRLVVRLFQGQVEDLVFEAADDVPTRAQRELETLRQSGPVRPMRERELRQAQRNTQEDQ